MKSLWNISTTVREPNRIYGFLKVAKIIENEVWDKSTQRYFQILLVKHREYLNDPSNSQIFHKMGEEETFWLSNLTLDMPLEIAESIVDKKDYIGGADMRGRTSMAPLTKMGLVYFDYQKKIIISDIGNKFINNEITVEEFFLDSLIKIQYPNPSDSSYKDWYTKPFVTTLHLIREVNERCKIRGLKEKGISRDEFGIFALSLQNYSDINRYADLILDYRETYENIKDEKTKKDFKENYIRIFLSDFNNPLKNTDEYSDNMIRYFRETKLVILRGKYSNTYIDFEPRRKTEIESILKNDDGRPLSFDNEIQWIKYFSEYGSYILPYETDEILTKILDDINLENSNLSVSNKIDYIPYKYTGSSKQEYKHMINEARMERTYLQNIQIKNEYYNINKIDETINALRIIASRDRNKVLTNKPSLELEKWANITLNIFNDAELIKPNTIVGDDNEPIHTAPGGVADIECYYKTFNAICEVTTLRARDQWINEGQPVMRHLREFERSSQKNKNYCIFIAPSIHTDTINTFWNSVKYEYEGSKQRIIPLTIIQVIELLSGVKQLHSRNKRLDSSEIERLLDYCSDVSQLNSSIDWTSAIKVRINDWVNSL